MIAVIQSQIQFCILVMLCCLELEITQSPADAMPRLQSYSCRPCFSFTDERCMLQTLLHQIHNPDICIWVQIIAFTCCFGSWEEFQKAEEMRRAWVHTLDRPPAGLPAGYVAPVHNPNEVPCYPAGWPSVRLFTSQL